MAGLMITPEKVLEAANSCSTAKEVLKKLFPEVFEDNTYIDLGSYVSRYSTNIVPVDPERNILLTKCGLREGINAIIIRTMGKYAFKGFLLSSMHEWSIKTDEYNCRILVPTKRP